MRRGRVNKRMMRSWHPTVLTTPAKQNPTQDTHKAKRFILRLKIHIRYRHVEQREMWIRKPRHVFRFRVPAAEVGKVSGGQLVRVGALLVGGAALFCSDVGI
jgi:hypothetical protein